MTSLSSSGRDCGTCAGERSGESGLLCGAETADQTGTWNVENASKMQQQIVNHYAIIKMQNTAQWLLTWDITCSCGLVRASACEEESGGEARVTCDPGESGTGPCVSSAEICLLWAGIATFSSAGTLTFSSADSVSEAGSWARGRGPL